MLGLAIRAGQVGHVGRRHQPLGQVRLVCDHRRTPPVALARENVKGGVAGLHSAQLGLGRHELLVQRLGEVHEGRCAELRSLIDATADAVAPLQAEHARHAMQLDELTAGISTLA